ncbi:hypothetical protein DUNSADRAFT_2230 [Dunaliella salina]|uniref:Plastid ribosomal protein S6 n=1 Tax=Dunaliella salina TaxID=3046 RepID=A0ABQ7GW49_DUNSA|nr:hypothetical protein DUNSADRAFT_2230 [Dunaliella salina]|eukprot:KAF5838767.1 hypothetical protein DUNSADRAFT_2230 [Dunaliella salina]
MQCLSQRQATSGVVRSSPSRQVAPQVQAPRPALPRHFPVDAKRTGVLAQVAATEADTDNWDDNTLYKGIDPETMAEMTKLPKGYHWYETMLILTPTLNDEDRDRELAKFEAYLNKEECLSINALVRGRSRLAYPMKTHWEGIYVLYTYAARRQTARAVQLMLSNPEVGSENVLLRHMTICKY